MIIPSGGSYVVLYDWVGYMIGVVGLKLVILKVNKLTVNC